MISSFFDDSLTSFSSFFRRPTSASVGRDELGGEEGRPEGLLVVSDEVKAANSAELGVLVGDEVVDEGEEEVVYVVFKGDLAVE